MFVYQVFKSGISQDHLDSTRHAFSRIEPCLAALQDLAAALTVYGHVTVTELLGAEKGQQWSIWPMDTELQRCAWYYHVLSSQHVNNTVSEIIRNY